MFRFASNEDTNQFWLRKIQIYIADPFYFEEKFKSTYKEDTYLFYFKDKELITYRSLKLRNRL